MTAAEVCAGSRRGTALNDFTKRGNEWLAPCGICHRLVSITIDGIAVTHPTPKAA